MANIEIIQPVRHFSGKPIIPGDKSISHRALLFGALSKGQTVVTDILDSADVRSTAQCLKQMGVQISQKGRLTLIDGCGSRGLLSPDSDLDCGNSGTTIRLLMGILASRNIEARLTGDSSLIRRPMKRVAEPLRKMGALISLTSDNFAPLIVVGRPLHGIHYELKVASAQIKTAIILAALNAEGTTSITGETQSRDHTERMLKDFGVHLDVSSHEIKIEGGQKLSATQVQVPGDPSTAAFWMAAAAMIPEASLRLENISLNPTRLGFARALERMGARVEMEVTSVQSEPIGTIVVKPGELRGVQIGAEEIPSLIDEIPILAILGSQAEGTFEVSGAEELRVKESDRIEAIANGLRAMGAEIEVRRDGFRIQGRQRLKGARIETHHDHRIAMAFSIAGLVAQGQTEILNSDCAGVSYPEFYTTLRTLTSEGLS